MSLLSSRNYYKPFDHAWMYDYWDLQTQMHWTHKDIPLATDVKDGIILQIVKEIY